SPFAFRGHYGKLAGSEVTEIVGRSIPLVVNEAAFSLAYFFMMRNYGLVSQSSVACLAVANNVSQLFFIGNKAGGPVIGVTVGGELGKGNYTDARNNALKTYLTCFALVACGGALMFLAAPVIPGFFHLEGELAQLCIRMLRMKAVIGAFGGNTMIFYNILRIGGATREVFIQDGLFSLLGPMLVSFIFSHFIPVSFLQLYIIVESMQIVKTGLGYYFFRKGTWLRKLSS
ncbi:MAG: hypothetical protein II161_01180, partial [Erysipelotrichaceae bacterium]|nr:hypothetical protein [Erysipelotrichaceae bacterium]